jgi:hypothetical protein
MAEPLRPIPAPQLPAEVELLRDDMAQPRFTPRELRTLKEQFGRSLGQILSDDESDDKFAALAWIKLRRQGFEVELEALDDVVITIRPSEVEKVDPSSGGSSTGSPPSAGTGA